MEVIRDEQYGSLVVEQHYNGTLNVTWINANGTKFHLGFGHKEYQTRKRPYGIVFLLDGQTFPSLTSLAEHALEIANHEVLFA